MTYMERKQAELDAVKRELKEAERKLETQRENT